MVHSIPYSPESLSPRPTETKILFTQRDPPVAYLHSTEAYFPSDIGSHLAHTRPEDSSGAVLTLPTSSSPLTLSNLDELNAFANSGADVYLTSKEGIEALPAWFQGTRPSADGTTGASTVASAIVTVAKANDTLDAFYFYFYAYNQGNWVLGSQALEFGDHVGDWEHTMVRFVHGVPQSVYFSQHSAGQAFAYPAVQKAGGLRPVVYVAKGTHANYAMPGPHDHTIPGLNTQLGPLTDHTDAGVFWDPLPGALCYDYNIADGSFVPYTNAATATATATPPSAWLNFNGRWGDNQLPDSTKGQLDVFGQRTYVAGPTGPRDKDLARKGVCPDGHSCVVMPVLVP
ncbi:hypothetical protein A1O3_02212 [Capronia epimyces CBS 606.96]|uniref:Vacuolar protein sorting-associated protein 62 n=1 Tax=Capronia epimyces CBS 606.96 TaxID=1182542 RepID=W9Y9D0_9EURO|nr:uncharacterized protein A1O3_02212 [Capronia epimyces CBS 606.96]EXJ89148.1 hypothetical protein A1O3_02212 [Capronia epimyces CBS 606.96]